MTSRRIKDSSGEEILAYLQERHPVIKHLQLFEAQPGKQDGEHLHANLHQLILYTGGAGTANLLNQSYPIEPQTICLISPGELHDSCSTGKTPLTGIICRFMLPAFTGQLLPSVIKLPTLKAIDAEMLLKKAWAETTVGEPANLIRAAFLLAELLILLAGEMENAVVEASGEPLSALVAAALEFMKASFREEIGVKDVAAHCGVTTCHFCRVFKKEMEGVSPLTYLRKLRLGLARERLFASREKITQIAVSSGFKTLKNLKLAFQKTYRMSPQEFRRQAYEGNGRRLPSRVSQPLPRDDE